MQFSVHLLLLFNSGLSILRVGNALQSNIGMWMHATDLLQGNDFLFSTSGTCCSFELNLWLILLSRGKLFNINKGSWLLVRC